MQVTLINQPCIPEVMLVAARTCYSNQTPTEIDKQYDLDIEMGTLEEKDKKLIEHLFKAGHHSVFEHLTYTFAIEGISRACSHQLVRHRVASYSQQSQRYVEFENGFVIPPSMREGLVRKQFVSTLKALKVEYDLIVQRLIDHGRTKEEAQEDARYILPNAAKTNIVMTMNVRELMHFCNVRCCNRAQWEIRELAWAILEIMRIQLGVIFDQVGPDCVMSKCKQGSKCCGKPYKKVIK